MFSSLTFKLDDSMRPVNIQNARRKRLVFVRPVAKKNQQLGNVECKYCYQWYHTQCVNLSTTELWQCPLLIMGDTI